MTPLLLTPRRYPHSPFGLKSLTVWSPCGPVLQPWSLLGARVALWSLRWYPPACRASAAVSSSLPVSRANGYWCVTTGRLPSMASSRAGLCVARIAFGRAISRLRPCTMTISGCGCNHLIALKDRGTALCVWCALTRVATFRLRCPALTSAWISRFSAKSTSSMPRPRVPVATTSRRRLRLPASAPPLVSSFCLLCLRLLRFALLQFLCPGTPSMPCGPAAGRLRVARCPLWMATILRMLISLLHSGTVRPLPIRLSTVVSTVGWSAGFNVTLLALLLFQSA